MRIGFDHEGNWTRDARTLPLDIQDALHLLQLSRGGVRAAYRHFSILCNKYRDDGLIDDSAWETCQPTGVNTSASRRRCWSNSSKPTP